LTRQPKHTYSGGKEVDKSGIKWRQYSFGKLLTIKLYRYIKNIDLLTKLFNKII